MTMCTENASRLCRGLALLLLFALLPACHSIPYDLSRVAIPISAKPAPSTAAKGTPFHIERKAVLWGHGLLGQSDPDIAALVTEAAEGYDRIASFRVSVAGGFHDWLVVHLTGTMVRLKTVTVEGVLLRDSDSR